MTATCLILDSIGSTLLFLLALADMDAYDFATTGHLSSGILRLQFFEEAFLLEFIEDALVKKPV
jgi:hypothetical protein